MTKLFEWNSHRIIMNVGCYSFAGLIEIRIPNEPKFPFHNYLLELVSEFDEKESSVYMNGVEHFIQHIWNDVVKNNWRKLNVRKLIPERLGVQSGVFYGYKNGKKAISILTLHKLLLLWQEFCNKSDGEIHKNGMKYTIAILLYPHILNVKE